MPLISEYKTRTEVDLDAVENGGNAEKAGGVPAAPAAAQLEGQRQHSGLEVRGT